MRGLSGKHVLVTGGGSGIGAAISHRLAIDGCRVSIFDVNIESAERVASDIRKDGFVADAVHVDITDRSQIADGIQTVERTAGPIFGLVNNAGWDRAIRFLDSSPDDWEKVIDINLRGPINVTHAVATGMAARKIGRVVFIASDAGRVGSSGESIYSACKGGVIALAKTLARELAGSGVTVNCLCPGPTETPLLANLDPDGTLVDALRRAIPLKRLAKPDDYPGMVSFMLSDDAAYMTGQTVSISGGLTMHG